MEIAKKKGALKLYFLCVAELVGQTGSIKRKKTNYWYELKDGWAETRFSIYYKLLNIYCVNYDQINKFF